MSKFLDKVRTKSLQDIFTSKWFLRVISVFIALSIWFFVSRTDNAPLFRSLRVPLELANTPEGFYAQTEVKSVNLQLTGDIAAISTLTPSSVRCYADLKGLKPGLHTLALHTDIPAGIKASDISPASAKVSIERKIERTLPINLEKGQDFPGEIKSFKLTPPRVTISGPQTYVLAVEAARVVIADKNISGKDMCDIELIWKDGKAQADKISVTPKQAVLDLALHTDKKAKRIALVIAATGQPQEGYRVENITVNPKSVIVEGTPEAISELQEITLESIDITGIKDSLELSIPIKLPSEELEAVGVTDAQVKIDVVSASSSRVIPNVPVKITGNSPIKKWILAPSAVSVMVEGPPEELEGLEGSSPILEAYVDVSDIVADLLELPVLVKSHKKELNVIQTEPKRVTAHGSGE